jgi:hypothetical protein
MKMSKRANRVAELQRQISSAQDEIRRLSQTLAVRTPEQRAKTLERILNWVKEGYVHRIWVRSPIRIYDREKDFKGYGMERVACIAVSRYTKLGSTFEQLPEGEVAIGASVWSGLEPFDSIQAQEVAIGRALSPNAFITNGVDTLEAFYVLEELNLINQGYNRQFSYLDISGNEQFGKPSGKIVTMNNDTKLRRVANDLLNPYKRAEVAVGV